MATGRLLCVGTTDAATAFAASFSDGEVETVPTTAAAREYFETTEWAACTTVFHDPPEADCFEVLDEAPGPVVVAADGGSSQLASDALGAGAADYVDLAAATAGVETVRDRVDAVRAREQDLDTYRTIVETVPEGVFVLDDTATIVDGNERGATLLGFDRETLLGTDIPTLIERGVFEESVVTSYQDAVADMLSEESDQETAVLETEVRPGGGESARTFEVRFALQPTDGEFRGTIGVLRDVTERKRRLDELEQYETMTQAIPETVFTIDESGEFGIANRTALERYGFTRTDIDAGVHYEDVVADEHVPRIRDAQDRLLSGDGGESTVTVDHTAVAKDGRRFPVETHFGLRWTDDGLTAAGISIDVSERRLRKRRLQVLSRVLRHNLRNDLNVVLNAADIIQRTVGDTTVLREADRIRSVASELTAVSEAVRELERSLERTRSDRGRVDLTDIVRAAIERVDTDRAVDIEVDLPAEAYVEAGMTLRTAIEQTVENAIEHHDGAAPEIEVSLAPDDHRHGDWVTLRIADDGPGIPAEERAVVVGGEGITPLQHGSGLGLWTIRWIVEAYGGEVGITDNDPRGTVVAVSLKQA